jgi:hypothetical protein
MKEMNSQIRIHPGRIHRNSKREIILSDLLRMILLRKLNPMAKGLSILNGKFKEI